MKNTKLHKVTAEEKIRYVLSTDADFEILDRCKNLKKMRLSKHDKELVKLIKTQLKRNWRMPLLQQLKKLLRKYADRSK